jgi:hypothetical protein
MGAGIDAILSIAEPSSRAPIPAALNEHRDSLVATLRIEARRDFYGVVGSSDGSGVAARPGSPGRRCFGSVTELTSRAWRAIGTRLHGAVHERRATVSYHVRR